MNPTFSSTYLRFQARPGRFSPGTDGKVCHPGEFLRSPRSSLWHPLGTQKWRTWTDPCLHVAPEAAHLKGRRGNIPQTAWSLAGTKGADGLRRAEAGLPGSTARGCQVILSCTPWSLIWNSQYRRQLGMHTNKGQEVWCGKMGLNSYKAGKHLLIFTDLFHCPLRESFAILNFV